MREKIIFAPGLNDTEILRSLSAHGVNSLGLRVMGTTALAKHALMHAGVVVQEEFLTQKEKAPLIDSFVRSISYFRSAYFADSKYLALALDALRSIITGNENVGIHNQFLPGEFEDKNKAIVQVYDLYMKEVQKSCKIDAIMLARKAINEAADIFAGDSSSDPQIIALEEFPLKPLETELLRSITGKEPEITNLVTLFNCQPRKLGKIRFLESYGPANEVLAILTDIAKKEIPYDQCTVALADSTQYAELFYEQTFNSGIPMTFGCGVSITNALPASLLKLVQKWDTTGYHGVDALNEILVGDATDYEKIKTALKVESTKDLIKLAEIAGKLQISMESASNNVKIEDLTKLCEANPNEYKEQRDFLESVKLLSAELSKGYAYFVANYAKIRKGPIGRIDKVAVKIICNELDSYASYSDGTANVKNIIYEILQKKVLVENSKEGALHITTLSGAFSVPRKNVYISGMSAAAFPGNPMENYLLLDSDYELFGDNMPTSENKIEARKEELLKLLNLYSALDISVVMSYSNFNPAEISSLNPSASLFEIYKLACGKNATIDDFNKSKEYTTYFKEPLTPADMIGKAFVEGKKIVLEDIDVENVEISGAQSYKMPEKNSPSAIEVYFNCPKQYFLKYIANIPQPDENDPLEVISSSELGTLVHSIMEELVKCGENPPSKEEFLKLADEKFSNFLVTIPPLSQDAATKEKTNFNKIMSNAYDSDSHNKVISAEEKYTVLHESGVNLYGLPDRVEIDKDGKYLIADFKTKRKVEHKENDIDSCLQVVIYAYMLEKKGFPIEYCEYRYLRKNVSVRCMYDETMKKQLNDKLAEFANAFETGFFPVNSNENSCKYCKYGNICGKTKA